MSEQSSAEQSRECVRLCESRDRAVLRERVSEQSSAEQCRAVQSREQSRECVKAVQCRAEQRVSALV